MFNLSKVFFGCSDATTEAQRNPQQFSEVFFDPNDYISELTNGYRYILSGRKGDGKTAFGEQIQLLANNADYIVWKKTLNNFNNSTFLQMKTYDSFGGNPYISFWNCVLLIEFVNMLNSEEPHIQAEDYNDLVYALNQGGFINPENDLSITVRKLVETNSELNINNVFKHNRKYNKTTTLRGVDQISDAIKNRIKDLYFQNRFVFIIDGVDDILNNSEFKSSIITGLIRAIDQLNAFFAKCTLKIKIILLIRDDILNLCRDPNLNKIYRDSGIRLSWTIPSDTPFNSNLIKLVGKRIDCVSHEDDSFEKVWKELFPDSIGTKNTLDYILDNLIYRPRDILQLFIEIQKEFVNGKKLTADKIQNALQRYSNEYFVESMKDELTGFFPDQAITRLPGILSRLGSRLFYFEEFEQECKKYAEFSEVSCEDILRKLFADGYIGQHRPRDIKDYTVFSYRNPREEFQITDECIVHRGLTRALTL